MIAFFTSEVFPIPEALRRFGDFFAFFVFLRGEDKKVIIGNLSAYDIRMYDFLPPSLKTAMQNLNSNLLYELRLRAERPVKVNYRGEYLFLGEDGVTPRRERAIVVSAREIADCVFAACDYSVYSCSEEMKECFLTAKTGERIGLGGTLVRENGKIIALRDVRSLCIRIPHPVQGCADKIFSLCEADRPRNCILLSAPGYGKTTVLRELCRLLGEKYPEKNILIADERGELSAFDTGDADVLLFGGKREAFSFGLRALRPDIIVTDELQEEEYAAVQSAMDAGLIVIASAHFGKEVHSFAHRIFERYVCFNNEKIGQASAIYDENLKNLL